MRYLLDVVGLDAGAAHGPRSHGRLPDHPADAPVLRCSDASLGRDHLPVTEVREFLLGLAGCRSRRDR